MTSAVTDLSRFNDTYFAEAVEHLEEMERILVSLDSAAPDAEELNALFRAAHSIKGGAGIFGFIDIMEVTHHLESLLDRVRNGELALAPDRIDLFLAAADVIAMQIAGHRDGAAVDLAAVADMTDRLAAAAEGSPGEAVAPAAAAEASSGGRRRYEIIFRPGRDILRRGIRIESLFAELEELGELSATADFPEVPPLDAIDPEECVAVWTITLDTTASEAEIRDIFEFVSDDSDIVVAIIDDASAPAASCCAADSGGGAAPTAAAAGERGDASVRVSVAKVDQLLNQVGELVITQAMLAQAADALDPVVFERLHRGLVQLERNTRALQEGVMTIRLVPISTVFSRFPRLVRDLAGKLGKRVTLRLSGEGTELDRGLIEKITDPLAHLVRNSLDHGIETPEARIAAGKEPDGTITLRASQVGGRIVIEVVDDGAGLRRDKILRTARDRGLAVSDDMSDEEVWQLIFAPGFSTADTVTDVSGRGVGMDVVMKNVQAMGGRVQVHSEEGAGSRFVLSLPLTLAIVDGLSIGVGDERFIIPLAAIVESFQPARADLKTVQRGTVVNVRGDYIPVIPLHEMFDVPADAVDPTEGVLVLVDAEGERGALLVGELLGQHQVVIKSLEENYRKVPGTAGATIMGDGRVALILDVGEVLQWNKGEGRKAKAERKGPAMEAQ